MSVGVIEMVMALDLETFEIIKGHQMMEITFMNPDHKDEDMRDIIHAIPTWLCGDERVRKIKISELDQILDKGVTVYWEYDPECNEEAEKSEDRDWKKRDVHLLVYYTMGKIDGKWLTMNEREDIWDRVKPLLAALMKEIVEEQQTNMDTEDKILDDEIKWEKKIQSQKMKQLEDNMSELGV